MIYKIIDIFIIILIALYLMFRNKGKKIETGSISGMVLFKIGEAPMEDAEVALGNIETSGSNQKFVVFDNLVTKTDPEGEFTFKNLELKQYWVKAEKNGKKALRLVKLTKENRDIEGVFFNL